MNVNTETEMPTPNPPSQSQSHLDNPPANPKVRRKGIAGRNQAADLQRFAFDAAMALKDGCTSKETGTLTMNPQIASAIHKLVGAWDTVADRLRVLRGRGLPKSVPATRRKRKYAEAVTFTEPAPPQPD
jgi:hypothetical protein